MLYFFLQVKKKTYRLKNNINPITLTGLLYTDEKKKNTHLFFSYHMKYT